MAYSNLQQAIDNNKFKSAVCKILSDHGINVPGGCGSGGSNHLPTDEDLLKSLENLGKSYSVVNAVLKSGLGIRIDKYDNGKSYKISSNANGTFGSDITHTGLGIELNKDTSIAQAILKVIESIDRAKQTAISAPSLLSAKPQKANQVGELHWSAYNSKNELISGVFTGLVPNGWYLLLDTVSQAEPLMVDLVPVLGEVYRSAVEQSRKDILAVVKKSFEQHIAQHHVGANVDLDDINNSLFTPPVAPPTPKQPEEPNKPDNGGSNQCQTSGAFLDDVSKLFKTN